MSNYGQFSKMSKGRTWFWTNRNTFIKLLFKEEKDENQDVNKKQECD